MTKTIFFLSNSDSKLYPSNSRSKFDSYIDTEKLDYLPNENIEAAIKSVTYDNTRDNSLIEDELLGIRSNICDFTIRNSGYDRIISLLHSPKGENNTVQLNFKNPTFFPTSKRQLSRASFEIINLKTNSPPNFKAGSPTYIQVAVRERQSKMKKPFNIFLDSSCPKSKKSYPSNNNMEFCIELPERMNFKRKWQVTLKSLFITNGFFNVHSCGYTYMRFRFSTPTHIKRVKLADGVYKTLSDILTLIKESFKDNDVKLLVNQTSNQIKFYVENDLFEQEEIHLYLNPYLSHLLGFNSFIGEDQLHKFDSEESKVWESSYPANIYSLLPKNLVVCCDICENTIFGGQYVKLLRLVNTPLGSSSDIISFDFLQNEFLELGFTEFGRIHIRIADVTGENVKCDPSIPTRLQIMFVNV